MRGLYPSKPDVLAQPVPEQTGKIPFFAVTFSDILFYNLHYKRTRTGCGVSGRNSERAGKKSRELLIQKETVCISCVILTV